MKPHRVPAATFSLRPSRPTVTKTVVTLALLGLWLGAPATARSQRAPAPPLPEIEESRAPHAPADRTPAEDASPEAPAGLPFFSAPGRRLPDAQAGATVDAVAEEQRYRDCLTLARRDPDAAFDRAFRWKTEGGGLPADHCIVVALIAIDRPAVAADRLRAMLEELKRGRGLPPDPLGGPASIDLLAARIYGQMGNAWLLADDPTQAIDAFDRALAILPAGHVRADLEIHLDRARAEGLAGLYEEAVTDLDRAEAIDPDRAEIFLLRASAERALGRYADAARDIERALELRADWPEALLERANLNAVQGHLERARSDWIEIATRWPGHPAAEAARRNLARLDAAGGTRDEDGDRDGASGPVQP